MYLNSDNTKSRYKVSSLNLNLNLIYWVGSNLLIIPRGTAQKMHTLYNGIYITKILKIIFDLKTVPRIGIL